MTDILASSAIELIEQNLPGESASDIMRRLGTVAGVTILPDDSDQQVFDKAFAPAAAQVVAAQGFADGAEQSAGLAQLAALTAPKVYATVADGQAAAPADGTFWVDGGDAGLQLYRRSGSASNLLAAVPTAGQLARGDGSALVGFQQRGNGAIVQDMREALREIRLGYGTDHGVVWDGVTDSTPGLLKTYAYQASIKSAYYESVHDYYGIGRLCDPKGDFIYSPISFPVGNNLVGVDMGGHAPYATTKSFNMATGNALKLRAYVDFHLHDQTLRNRSPSKGDTVALYLDPTGGGGKLTIARINFEGFGTAIKNVGDIDGNGAAVPGNGDKTLVQQTLISDCNNGYDQTRNNQAVGWCFLNCAMDCADSALILSGAGTTLLLANASNINQKFIRYPEGSGNDGIDSWPGSTTGISVKLEQHGTGAYSNLFIDARESVAGADAGGSNVDTTWIDLGVTATPTIVPDPDNSPIIVVGNSTAAAGSNSMTHRFFGGWLRGVIEYWSAHFGSTARRWSFERMRRSPLPEKAQLLGPGNHPLFEWRANENVPLDQYRGGEAHEGAIDPTKAFVTHPSGGRVLINSSGGAAYGPRYGGQFELSPVGGFPPKCTITGLAVFIDSNPSGSDTLIEWFKTNGGAVWTDGVNGNVKIGEATIPGDGVGLFPVVMNDPAKWQRNGTGKLFVRITKPAAGQLTIGHLAAFYYAFMGT